MASLDQGKYNWYPNREINSPLSTYTVSPEPKRFVTEIPADLSDIDVCQPSLLANSVAQKGRHFSIAIKNFEGGDALSALAAASKKYGGDISNRQINQKAGGGGALPKAFRRHTVLVLNPITEKQQQEEMEWQ